MDIVILSMIAVGVYSAFSISMKAIAYYKNKAIAAAIANEMMETIRAKPYIEVGSVNNVPSGDIEPEKVVTNSEDGVEFWVQTEIKYVDDPADGIAVGIDLTEEIEADPEDYKQSNESDFEPYDYKRITIKVSKNDRRDRILATVVSDMASAVAETYAETGAFEVCLRDSYGRVVPDGKVLIELQDDENYHYQGYLHIVRNVDEDTGCIFQPNLQEIININNPGDPIPSEKLYQITGYYSEGDEEYSSATRSMNIIVQQLSSFTITIDPWKILTINSKYLDGTPIDSPQLEILGGESLLKNKTGDSEGVVSFDATDRLPTTEYMINSSKSAGGITDIYPVYFSIPEKWDRDAWKKYNEDNLSEDYSSLVVDAYFTDNASLPQHLMIKPVIAATGGESVVEIYGLNLDGSSTAKLVSSGGSEIIATYNIPRYTANDPADGYGILECMFDLTSASIEKYDLVISNSSGEVVLPDYFEVS